MCDRESFWLLFFPAAADATQESTIFWAQLKSRTETETWLAADLAGPLLS